MASEEETGTNRITAFSDSVIGVIITIMVFNLKSPDGSGWRVMGALWPTFTAYGLSYMFVAICWMNHHYVMVYVKRSFPSLIWSNFAFLFTMSFLPFTTSYLAQQRMSSFAVLLYALSFMPMLLSFMILETVIAHGQHGSPEFKRWYLIAMIRGIFALAIHGTAALLADRSAILAFSLILANTVLYISPESLRSIGHRSRPQHSQAARPSGVNPCEN